jgi:hypothetical protein
MDGVFINLTNKDIELIIDNEEKTDEEEKIEKTIVVPANPDLVTPTKETVYTSCVVNAVLSTPLKKDDIHYLQGTNWINTLYNKITRSEEDVKVGTYCYNQFVKYAFTPEQIEKINHVSNKRTRLFILEKEEVEYWSDGKFECPFRNYRLFTYKDKHLIEYPIPKTYLDLVVNGVKSISDKFRG